MPPDTAESYFWRLLTFARRVDIAPVLPYYQQELAKQELEASRRKAISWMDEHWSTVELIFSVSRFH